MKFEPPSTGVAAALVRAPASILSFVALALAAGHAPAQQARGLEGTTPAIAELVRVGDEAHVGLRPLDALERYRQALDVDPESYPALWRAARETVALGALASQDDAQDQWYGQAVEYARGAVAVRPEGVEGRAWLANALWHASMDRGTAQRARAADEILSEARRALELDPSNAMAHRILGEWHADVMRLSAVARWTIRRLVSADAVDGASWASAIDHLRLAVTAEPQGLAHHFALGRALLDAGFDDEGRASLRQVLDRPSVEPVDPVLKQQAQELLASR